MIRKEYAKSRRRIHAADSHFKKLKERSIKLLGRHDVTILSIFQLTQELPFNYFDNEKIKFDSVYADLLKKLFMEMSLGEYQKVRIIIDARKHDGGKLAEKKFQKEIDKFLKNKFTSTHCVYKAVHSYLDILVELADFVSNTFYREYQNDIGHVFEDVGFRLIQIKNPL
ncbi:hypothetical protein HY932_03500 [Candidatus Falkowbacteria bacterium]|nr:hypothetical protein [Candidatus Falkowbacteria bacterium]